MSLGLLSLLGGKGGEASTNDLPIARHPAFSLGLLGQLGGGMSLGVLGLLQKQAQKKKKNPMEEAGSNIAQFQGGLNQDLAGANQFAGDLLAQRHGSLGGIENSMAATMASQGVGNRYSGQGMPNPGDWVPAPDGGRLVWSQAGMWERQ